MSETAPPTASARLGRYLLLEKLPREGLVQPWIARREGAIELCVVEHLHPDAGSDEAAAGRFRRRALLAAHLRHPNLVETLSTSVEEGVLCVSRELVLGVSLERLLDAHRLERRPLPTEIFAAIALRVLRALAHLHASTGKDGRSLALVHRHLAPRSVMVGFAGEVKLGDFTAAKADVGTFRTSPGMEVGTVAYMSPEQVHGLPLDPRSDLYAASVLFYELLTGVRAVPEGSLPEMLRTIAEDTPAPILLRRTDISGAIARAVERSLAKRPEGRHPSAIDYLGELQQALGAASGAGREEVSKYVRGMLPGEERAALDRWARVRAASLSLPAPNPVAVAPPAQLPVDDLDLEEAPPEPSVMTMPGLPAVADPADLPLASPRFSSPSELRRKSRPPERRRSASSPRVEVRRRRAHLGFALSVVAAAGVSAASAALLRERLGPPKLGPAPERRAVEAKKPAREAPTVAREAPKVAREAPKAVQEAPTARPAANPPPPVSARPPPEPARRSGMPSGSRSGAARGEALAPGAADAQEASPSPAPEDAALSRAAVELEALTMDMDPRKFLRAHRQLTQLVASLPTAARVRAERLLDAAERAQDVTALEEVLALVRAAAAEEVRTTQPPSGSTQNR